MFGAWVDGKKVFESDVMKRGDAPMPVSIDLTGAQSLVLAVIDANDGTAGDNADWAGAAIITQAGPAVPRSACRSRRREPRRPSLRAESSAPMINYPRITGATPGRPFLFRIPASGDGPLTFSATNLPAGLKLDAATGIITGALQKEGRTEVPVSVKGRTAG